MPRGDLRNYCRAWPVVVAAEDLGAKRTCRRYLGRGREEVWGAGWFTLFIPTHVRSSGLEGQDQERVRLLKCMSISILVPQYDQAHVFTDPLDR